MQNLFEKYIQSISAKFSHPETSEMGYRADFEILLKGIFESIKVERIDHDAKAKEGNKPDFVVIKHSVPIVYIEAKDISVSLDKVEKSEQMARYYGYANLVLTDYVEFRFYRNGVRYQEPIKIGNYDLKSRTITAIPEQYEHVAKTLLDFTQSHKEPIRSGAHLAKIMGGKAQRIRDNVRRFLAVSSDKNAELIRLYETMKKLLIHDLTPYAFADMYAQTLVYGLFVARYHDETKKDFSRQEARELIPKSNPLLRHFFDHIVGPNFDKRLENIVNELCEVFSHADIEELMQEYFKEDLWGKTSKGFDPVVHFYEDFLNEYDEALRKKMGAYYTPLPVVQFIVRSVDYLLTKEFGLAAGLADTAKTPAGIHRVQILDPAVGTGTFISTIIRNIYERLLKKGQKGTWPSYVHNDLLPRLHGFELMMAPYTIAHLKLSIAFKKTGFKYFHDRLGIYLTNSLEETPVQDSLFAGFGFAQSIADESKEASEIKDKRPIMVVVGNPPYAGESSNKHYVGHDVYKVEPAGGKLKERNSKWLNDDYVKFIRFAESMVEKTGEGVVGMITAHGYIDNPTFRGMRWHLMQTFDEIYVLDLHGNANKKEKAPDGSEDKNVFDIKQGVAIFFGIKRKNLQSGQAKMFRADCFGSRLSKFQFLDASSINSVKWDNIIPSVPNYEWVIRDVKTQTNYQNGIKIVDLFNLSGVGIVTARDDFIISNSEENILSNAEKFRDSNSKTAQQLCDEVGISNKKGWDAIKAKDDLMSSGELSNYIKNISYRPFDVRKIFYHPALVWRMVEKIMRHFVTGKNLAIVVCRQVKAGGLFQHVFISNNITESTLVSNKTSEIGYVFPLYLYADDGSRTPNFKKEVVDELEKIIDKVSPEDIFDYIYAVLHSPSYREKYKEFLKIDFPRVPYPKDTQQFKALVALGKELRGLHLLESPKVNQFITTYPVAGSDTVEKPVYKDGNVFINKEQYFGNVPEVAWNFYIGGYQPAQKWLKDRKGRVLANADIEHYQKMIVALAETGRIMGEVDKLYGLSE